MFHLHAGSCTKYVTPQKTLIWLAFAVCLSLSLALLALFHTQEIMSVVFSENKTLTRIFGFHTAEVANKWKKLHNEDLHKPYSSHELLRWLNQECHSVGSFYDARSQIQISTRRRDILTEVSIFLPRHYTHVRMVPLIRSWPLGSTFFPYHRSLSIITFNVIQSVQLKPSIDSREA
jgi:hypothetical protein